MQDSMSNSEIEVTDVLVSIIVPVHNAARYLDKTISMVNNQTYRDYELILVDDASTDDSVEQIEKARQKYNISSKRIRVISKKVNEGAASARNTGLKYARGRYIAFLDVDDVWHDFKLEEELKFIEEKSAAFVFTAYEFGDENARPTGKIVSVPETLDYKRALSRTIIFTSTVLFDTQKIDKSLLKMPHIASEDTATWWRILQKGYVAYGYNKVTTIYRRPAKSLSSNKFVAIQRIYNLYRQVAHLSVISSVLHLFSWAVRATLRRLIVKERR